MNYFKALFQNPQAIINITLGRLPKFSFLRNTADYQSGANFRFWYRQKVLNRGGNKKAYWPVDPSSYVSSPQNILIGIDAYPGLMKGNYIQGMGHIYIGDYTQIGPNVNIISANHDLHDTRIHIPKHVVIGKYCWIGAGASIMPGITLGDFTIVAAGAVVTKSFAEGYCVVGGNTAKVIKLLEPEKCIRFENKKKYYGYIPAEKFEAYRKKHLKV